MENFVVYICQFMIMTLCKEYYSQLHISVRILTVVNAKLVLLKNGNTKFTSFPSYTQKLCWQFFPVRACIKLLNKLKFSLAINLTILADELGE